MPIDIAILHALAKAGATPEMIVAAVEAAQASEAAEKAARVPWVSLRIMVFERDKYTCVYCGGAPEVPHCDHIIPRSRGGSDDIKNLATACPDCNLSKGTKTPEEWRA